MADGEFFSLWEERDLAEELSLMALTNHFWYLDEMSLLLTIIGKLEIGLELCIAERDFFEICRTYSFHTTELNRRPVYAPPAAFGGA